MFQNIFKSLEVYKSVWQHELATSPELVLESLNKIIRCHNNFYKSIDVDLENLFKLTNSDIGDLVR